MRELDLDGIPANQRNWLNDHTVYTHGFGLVAAYGNQRTADGQPVFYERNIPPGGRAARVRAADLLRRAVAVVLDRRRGRGRQPARVRLPGQQRGRARRTAPTPARAVSRSARCPRKLAYALKYRELNLLLSDAVNDKSRILDHREPLERVERVAPWLTLDGNPYPAVVDGRVQWIIDGYTTSADYPYSRLTEHRQRDVRLGDRTVQRRHDDRQRPGQLHAQLGQGDRRRLRRLGEALRVGRQGPAAQGVEQGVRQHRAADERDQRAT